MNPAVDEYLARAKKWQQEMEQLRAIALAFPLEEEIKWRVPCYTYRGKIVLMIAGFKDYCFLSFFKGVLLKDEAGLLQKPGENTQSGRVLHFTDVQQVVALKAVVQAYIKEAIEIEQAGTKVKLAKREEVELVAELQEALDENPAFKAAFMALTPGRQRAYNLHISGAKQAATRKARVEKHRSRILAGFGLNDCTCGQSQRMPTCDGSHKHL